MSQSTTQFAKKFVAYEDNGIYDTPFTLVTKQFTEKLVRSSTATHLVVDLATTEPLYAVFKKGSLIAGATLTIPITSPLIIDGREVEVGNTLLVKNQGEDAKQHGLYSVVQIKADRVVLQRHSSAMLSGQFVKGMSIIVLHGEVNSRKTWTLSNTGSIILDTTLLVFEQFGYGDSLAGDGLENLDGCLAVKLDGAGLKRSPSGLRLDTMNEGVDVHFTTHGTIAKVKRRVTTMPVAGTDNVLSLDTPVIELINEVQGSTAQVIPHNLELGQEVTIYNSGPETTLIEFFDTNSTPTIVVVNGIGATTSALALGQKLTITRLNQSVFGFK